MSQLVLIFRDLSTNKLLFLDAYAFSNLTKLHTL